MPVPNFSSFFNRTIRLPHPRRARARHSLMIGLILLCSSFLLHSAVTVSRNTLSLDGTWQIAEGKLDQIPDHFEHTVPVPGLVSLAQPPFVEPGPVVNDRNSVAQKDPRRDAFWYRRNFRTPGPLPAVAIL